MTTSLTPSDGNASKVFVQNDTPLSNNSTITKPRSSSNTKKTAKNKAVKKPYKKCDRLVMYSTTWYGACKSMRRKLKGQRIKYNDNVVDKNHAMNQIFERKMKTAGRSISYPTIEINGKIVDYKSVQYYQNKYNLCKK